MFRWLIVVFSFVCSTPPLPNQNPNLYLALAASVPEAALLSFHLEEYVELYQSPPQVLHWPMKKKPSRSKVSLP